MDSLCHGFGDSDRAIDASAGALAIKDDDIRLFTKEAANELITQAPDLRQLFDRKMMLECLLGRDCPTTDSPLLQAVRIQTSFCGIHPNFSGLQREVVETSVCLPSGILRGEPSRVLLHSGSVDPRSFPAHPIPDL